MSETRRWLLGGELAPIGGGIAFLDRPLDEVVAKLVEWRTGLGHHLQTQTGEAFPRNLKALDPVQSPWTVELFIEHGNWTAYLNNSRAGTDLSNDHLARALDCNWVSGQHYPRSAVGHAMTEFSMSGPEGNPPLMGIRTVYSYAADGRWEFNVYGVEQPFEQTEAYSARLKRDRFTREMLMDYLAHFDIHPDDVAKFGRSVVVRQIVNWKTYTNSLAGEREYLGMPLVDDEASRIIA
ncbi:MAG TPA: hypothetical protein VHZ98_06535 [Galbitalea sp.]|jgi:hypothetical protein|nr:hypothetical protein [Galbitalea sp.]